MGGDLDALDQSPEDVPQHDVMGPGRFTKEVVTSPAHAGNDSAGVL